MRESLVPVMSPIYAHWVYAPGAVRFEVCRGQVTVVALVD